MKRVARLARPLAVLRHLLFWLAAAAALPTAALVALGLSAPPTAWGAAGLVSLAALVAGLLLSRRGARLRWVARAATLALIGIVVLRCAVVRGKGGVRLVTLPKRSRTANVNRAVAERDIAVGGSRILELKGVVPRGFVGKLAAAYDRLAGEVGEIPSPLVATYLGLQRPDRFDTLVIDLGRAPRRQAGAVVFLHGYAGNVGLICWLVAHAAAPHGLRTYCPSVGPRGDWWTRAGERTLAATLRHLRNEGVRRVYLVGLSNGAAGASVLAPRFRRQLDGLVLISGLSRGAGAPGVPTLLVHGRSDPAVPEARARRYLRRARGRATRVTMAGDHFVLLTREERVRAAVGRWLGRLEKRCSLLP